MEDVLKVGGSLIEHPSELKGLCRTLASLAKTHKMLVVPGGGVFADLIRRIDEVYGLSNTIAHRMAILAMDQYGLFLSNMILNSFTCYSLEEARNAKPSSLPILLPSRYMLHEDPLEHSWDVTSDSIAAYIAGVLNAKKIILVTDVDGIYTEDPKKNTNAKFISHITATELINWGKRTSVDKVLPEVLIKFKLNCYVVNGIYPDRVRAVIEGRDSIYTHITPQ
ncbi:MAG: delta 1-pyrroline-5-carboxylate synthetase [Candidatus Bathyarchaeia archaeon]